MSSGTKSKEVVKEERNPWAPAIPYLTDIMGQASSLFQQGQNDTFYPFSTTVPFSNQTEDALGMFEDRARSGSPLIDVANEQVLSMMAGNYSASPYSNYLTATAQGASLNGNPWLDTMFNQAADRITNRVNATAGLKGRAGSGAHQQLLQSELGNLANNIYAQNYQQERSRQVDAITNLQNAWESDYTRRANAINAAQSLAMVPYQDAEFLRGVGEQRESLAQTQLKELGGRHDFVQEYPWNLLSLYSQALNGMGNQGGTTDRVTNRTSTSTSSPLDILSSAVGILTPFKKWEWPS